MNELGRRWWQELQAIMPEGHGSVLHLKYRQLALENYSPAMVVNQLAHQLGVDLRAVRRRLRKLLNRRMVPLPLLPELTLVPLRVSQGPGPLWGFIVYERAVLYRSYKQPPFHSAILLDFGTSIGTLHSPGTLRRIWRETLAAKREENRYYRIYQPPDPQLNEPWPSRPYILFNNNTGQQGPN